MAADATLSHINASPGRPATAAHEVSAACDLVRWPSFRLALLILPYAISPWEQRLGILRKCNSVLSRLKVRFWHEAELSRTSVVAGTADLQMVKLKDRV